MLRQSVDLQRIFSLENFSTSTFLHKVKLEIDASLLISDGVCLYAISLNQDGITLVTG